VCVCVCLCVLNEVEVFSDLTLPNTAVSSHCTNHHLLNLDVLECPDKSSLNVHLCVVCCVLCVVCCVLCVVCCVLCVVCCVLCGCAYRGKAVAAGELLIKDDLISNQLPLFLLLLVVHNRTVVCIVLVLSTCRMGTFPA